MVHVVHREEADRTNEIERADVQSLLNKGFVHIIFFTLRLNCICIVHRE